MTANLNGRRIVLLTEYPTLFVRRIEGKGIFLVNLNRFDGKKLVFIYLDAR